MWKEQEIFCNGAVATHTRIVKYQTNSNYCVESKNSEIPTDKIEQNTKEKKSKKKKIVSA